MRHRDRSSHSWTTLSALLALFLVIGLAYSSRRADAQIADERTITVGDASDCPTDAAADCDDDAATDTSAPPIKADADTPPAPPADDNTPQTNVEAAQDGQVLEVPQVVGGPGKLGQGHSGDVASGSDDDATPSGEDDTAAVDDDVAGVPGEVGSLDDYENQAALPPVGAMVYAPGMMAPQFASRLGVNRPPLALSPTGPIMGAPIRLPPTSSGPFPSTSPMLMSPGFRAPMLHGPGSGLWLRAR